MDEHATRAARAIEDASKTADRLARRMGAEFVRDPQASQAFQSRFANTREPLPIRR